MDRYMQVNRSSARSGRPRRPANDWHIRRGATVPDIVRDAADKAVERYQEAIKKLRDA